MSRIAPGITLVAGSKISNSFIVEGDDGLTLVDVGTGKAVGEVLRAIDSLGRKPADVRRIVVTHAHPDHVQGVPELREKTDATVLIHHADAAWLPNGRVPSDGRSGLGARNFDRLASAHWTPFKADETVDDGALIEGAGLRVIHTPGHSPGHIVLLHEPTRTVLVGDAVFHNNKIDLGPAGFAADPDSRGSGAARIPTDIAAVGFAHGKPLTDGAVEPFVAFLGKLG